MKGRSDRIAAIHAVYGSAWAGFGYVVTPGWIAGLLLAIGLLLLFAATLVLFRDPARSYSGAAQVGKSIKRINVATGAAIMIVAVGLHALHADRLLPSAILVVMAIHFVPLWRLLRRRSLLVMAAALGLAAAMALLDHELTAAILLAGVTFLVNAGRLLLNSSRSNELTSLSGWLPSIRKPFRLRSGGHCVAMRSLSAQSFSASLLMDERSSMADEGSDGYRPTTRPSTGRMRGQN